MHSPDCFSLLAGFYAAMELPSQTMRWNLQVEDGRATSLRKPWPTALWSCFFHPGSLMLREYVRKTNSLINSYMDCLSTLMSGQAQNQCEELEDLTQQIDVFTSRTLCRKIAGN